MTSTSHFLLFSDNPPEQGSMSLSWQQFLTFSLPLSKLSAALEGMTLAPPHSAHPGALRGLFPLSTVMFTVINASNRSHLSAHITACLGRVPCIVTPHVLVNQFLQRHQLLLVHQVVVLQQRTHQPTVWSVNEAKGYLFSATQCSFNLLTTDNNETIRSHIITHQQTISPD